MRKLQIALFIVLGTLGWAAEKAPVAHYDFSNKSNLGHDKLENHQAICVDATASTSPVGPAIVLAGTGKLELPADRCPSFSQGFGVDLWLRLDDLSESMLVAGRDDQFLLRLDSPKEGGQLSFFLKGTSWEPRLRGPRLEKEKWYHIQAGWNKQQMILRVDQDQFVLQRRMRLRRTRNPLLFGGELEWGKALQGALSKVQLFAPAPDDWFQTVPTERLCGAVVKIFEVENAYPRAKRNETVALHLQADKEQPAGQITLHPGAGLHLVGKATHSVPALLADQGSELRWSVSAKTAGTYQLTLTDNAGVSQKRTVQFHRHVAQQKLDYVPEPKPVETEVLVGAQMCPLWKEGARRQVWAPIVPWEKRKPVLGYYDEGDPEVMDWEIKWCLDHGISFFVYCWYRANQKAPVSHRLGHGIHEGLFRSRYQDQFKFAIMWENQGKKTAGVASEEDFLQTLLPFWIETYFKRGNYLVLDGKPLLYIYRPEFLIEDLGSVENVRQALNKARAACRAAGFKGLTLLGEYRGSNPEKLQQMVGLGLDYSFAYCWPLPGNPSSEKAVDMQEKIWEKRQEMNIIPEMINVSMGWDSRPWHPSASIWRHTPEDFSEACKRALKATKKYPKDSLSSRVVILDNWNEYGEGHYLFPHRQYGFGYLDAIRAAFAPNAPQEHLDLTPADIGRGPYDHRYQNARQEKKRIDLLLKQKPKNPVREDGLIAYWSFDDNASKDTVMDQTGNRLGAHLRGSTLVPGKIGKALLCNGRSAQTGNNPQLFPERLTVSCWIRTDEANQSDRWFLNCIYSKSTDAGYRLGLSGGRLCWGVPESNWSHHLRAKEPLPLGRYVHVAVTADANIMRIYMDGREIAQTERTLPVGAPLERPLSIGNYEWNHRAHFIGTLDELKLYDRALTPAQIKKLAEK